MRHDPHALLQLGAAICWGAAAVGWPVVSINLVAAGLFLFALTWWV